MLDAVAGWVLCETTNDGEDEAECDRKTLEESLELLNMLGNVAAMLAGAGAAENWMLRLTCNAGGRSVTSVSSMKKSPTCVVSPRSPEIPETRAVGGLSLERHAGATGAGADGLLIVNEVNKM